MLFVPNQIYKGSTLHSIPSVGEIMSAEELFLLISSKLPCHIENELRRRNINISQQKEECILLRGIFAEAFTFEETDGAIRGEFRVSAQNLGDIFVVGPPLRRILRYSELCVSEATAPDVTYLLSTLPPLYMQYFLNERYPTEPNFGFLLECSWIPSPLIELLSEKINQDVLSFTGDYILKHCCEYLQNEALRFLFSSSIDAPFVLNTFSLYAGDGDTDAYQITEMLVNHAETMLDIEFEKDVHECPICMDDVEGLQCFRFRICRHFACRTCAAKSIEEQINQGTNACEPTCTSCNELLRPQEIFDLVTQEVYTNYEKRLLNRTLGSMKDVVPCSNKGCNFEHVLLNDYSDGVCPQCQFHFCARCGDKFHEDTPCQTGPLAALPPAEATELVDRYKAAGPDGRANMEMQYGKANLENLIQNSAANEFIKRECKRCPNCHVPIEKNTGCNRMTCYSCRKNFCWLCLAVLSDTNPYGHFSDQCRLHS